MSQQPFHVIGREVERRDGLGHVTGTTEYVDDVRYPGMLHLKMVRNPLVHARIKGVDLSEAEKVPGFVTALTAKVTDATLDLWTRLLRRAPEARLLLYARTEAHRDRVRHALREAGRRPGA